MHTDLKYQSGFGNHFETEALPQTLPLGQNSPQRVAHGLYAEQLSGTAFTAPRSENARSWLYRIRPSVLHGKFEHLQQDRITSQLPHDLPQPPTQMRWDPLPIPTQPLDWLASLQTWCVAGDFRAHAGSAVHLYACNQAMKGRYFYNADGELLLVPQEGGLVLRTELGVLTCRPGEIAVIPRGVKFLVELQDKHARGYVCENFGQPFKLPDLGPIGANGLANPRDFLTPVAAFEEKSGSFQLVAKYRGQLWTAALEHSPLDVVGWHGNYAPYKYDLARFNVINTVSFDHPDPSIFTVLTSSSDHPGTANLDFVIFPPRWMVAEHTFRPPYFHRNVMSEYMGLIRGMYDAKEAGFVPGGGSLHNCMSAHGPESAVFEKASSVELKPQALTDTLAFMFECRYSFGVTQTAQRTPLLQDNYLDCWKSLSPHFKKG